MNNQKKGALLQELADTYGVSAERVRQLEMKDPRKVAC